MAKLIPPYALEFLLDPALLESLFNEETEPEDENIARLWRMFPITLPESFNSTYEDWEMLFYWIAHLHLKPKQIEELLESKLIVGTSMSDEPGYIYWNNGPELLTEYIDVVEDESRVEFVIWEGEMVEHKTRLVIVPVPEVKLGVSQATRGCETRLMDKAAGDERNRMRTDTAAETVEVCAEGGAAPGTLPEGDV